MADYDGGLSLILSRVMDDIGVNKECLIRRRRLHLMEENCHTLRDTLRQSNITTHLFGSQAEGTTTPGLQSETDVFTVNEDYNVILDMEDWVPDKVNLLMIQDDVTSPGYCKLQRLRHDQPLPMNVLPIYESYMYDEKRRVLLKSNLFQSHENGSAPNHVKAECRIHDLVDAFPSPTLSNVYKEWSSRQRPSNWPTLDMIEYMGNLRCYVVPYDHLDEGRPNIDWRISTSLAERFLMFSLNITQIRCYVLLKMINKTFIEPHMPDVISSYICKTMLFHCLERTRGDFWIEPNLVQCVNHVLLYMIEAVHTKDCPNYFNDASNLLFGKVDDEIQEQLMTKIREVVRSDGRFLLEIGFDDLNSRLALYNIDRNLMLSVDENEIRKSEICGEQTLYMSKIVSQHYYNILLDIEDNDMPRDPIIPTITDFIRRGGLQRRTGVLMLPFICSYLATVDACECLLKGKDISPRTLQLYRLSLGSDAASSILKYASFLYCTGQFESAISVLRDLERRLTLKGKDVTFCACDGEIGITTDQFNKAERQNVYPSTSNVALCVMFTRAEIQCCPRELQFEFYRSTDEEKLYRKNRDSWMDLAVLDWQPYLYYLQYKTARHLGRKVLQFLSLQNLKACVCSEYLGHRETAYNVLGQCLELESKMDEALMYYKNSFLVRPRNNAAKWHVARLCFGGFVKENKKQRC